MMELVQSDKGQAQAAGAVLAVAERGEEGRPYFAKDLPDVEERESLADEAWGAVGDVVKRAGVKQEFK